MALQQDDVQARLAKLEDHVQDIDFNSELIDRLINQGMISQHDVCTESRERIILDRFRKGSVENFLDFCMALDDTGQSHILRLLDIEINDIRAQKNANIVSFTEELKKVIQEQGHTPDWKKDNRICLKDQFIPPSLEEEGRQGKEIDLNDMLSWKKGNKLTLVKGKAAIGKTTLAQWLAKQWADGSWAGGFRAVFVLDVRALSTQDVLVDLTELLTQKAVYNIQGNHIQLRKWLDNLAQTSIIFLEGLDKITPRLEHLFKKTTHIHDPDTKTTPLDWFINILRQDILPGACKIITSRPCTELSHITFSQTFQLLGITHEKAKEFLKQKKWTTEEKQHLQSMLDRISYYGVIFSSMFDILTSSTLHMRDDYTTITNRTANLVMEIASRHNNNDQFSGEILPPLSRLAQQSQPDLEKLVFGEQDLNHANINHDELAKIEESGLLISTNVLGEDGKYCLELEFFDHSVQTLLFVGSYLLGADSQHEIAFNVVPATWATKLAQRFLVGLTLDKTSGPITHFKTALGYKMATTLDKEVKVERLCTKVAEACSSRSPERVIQLLQIVFESQSSHLTKHLARTLVQEQSLQINSTDLSSVIPELIFVMKNFEELRALKLTQANIDDPCLSMLLSFCSKSSITSINFSGNQIDEGLKLLSECEEMKDHFSSMDANFMRTRGTHFVAEALRRSTCLAELDLSMNIICDEGAKSIADALLINKSLKTLSLKHTRITSEGARSISCSLKVNTSLTSLSLDWNPITETGAEQLADAMTKNTCLTYLSLNWCGIGSTGGKWILRGLTKNTRLKTLKLDGNGLTDDTTQTIAQCLRLNTCLTTLSLNENCISAKGAEVILQALETNPYLITLNLELNDTDLGAELISDTLRRNALSRLGLPEDAGAAQFTDENGGILQLQDSDVCLTVPPGAVPAGMTFSVYGIIHTNLAQFNSWMQSKEEYIAGPVPEYKLEGGERFEKPVEIRIPHCVGKDSSQVRVLFGTEQGFKEITNEDDMSFYIQDGFVHISTMHFTKFVLANTDTTQEITDALLTLAASFTKTDRKQFITLRLMLHSDCAGQNDFAAIRTAFYNPGMEEIGRLKVMLPSSENPVEFPSIEIKLKLDSDWQDRCRTQHASELASPTYRQVLKNRTKSLATAIPKKLGFFPSQTWETLVCKRDGKDVLFRSESSLRNRSEQLTDFNLESIKAKQLSGIISICFDYGNKITYEQTMNVVYPSPPGTTDAENPRQLAHVSSQLTENSLSKKRSDTLTNTADILMERVELSPFFWAILARNKVLVKWQEEKIKGNGRYSPAEMIGLLIDHLKRGTNAMYEGFIDTLVNTHQSHIASDILLEDVSTYTPFH